LYIKYQSRCDAHACCTAWATPGFSGAPPSGPRSHHRRTCPAALRCAGLDRFASAKQRPPFRLAFIARPPPHPSHSCACEGPEARKTLRGPRSSKGYTHHEWYWIDARSSVGMGSWYFSAEGGGVFRLAPSTLQRARCGDVGCEKRCRRRVFQGLRRRLNERSELGRRGCEPVLRYRSTVKTRSSTCGEASTGVAPRLVLVISDICYGAYARSKHGHGTATGKGWLPFRLPKSWPQWHRIAIGIKLICMSIFR
jgi:hypothetical protein